MSAFQHPNVLVNFSVFKGNDQQEGYITHETLSKKLNPNPGQLLRSTLSNVVVTSYILVFKWSSLSPTIIVKKTIPSLTSNISSATRLSHLYRSGLQDSRLYRTSGKRPKHLKQPPLPECRKYCHDQLWLSNREKRAAMGINTESPCLDYPLNHICSGTATQSCHPASGRHRLEEAGQGSAQL